MISRLSILALVVACLLGGIGTVAASKPAADVRVVIDISGSMKRTDPRNLRRSALGLLVRLLPSDTRAGVWTFGHSVDVLLPLAPVDQAWRARGLEQADRIDSNALLTDIPAALEAAAAGHGDSASVVDVILLTDGVVDVSKSAADNAAARQRLVEEIAPRMRDAKVRIHAVALSSEADAALLEQLALTTGGTFAVAETAAALQQIFVQALDAAAPAEHVPLTDNRFLVDATIEELTALVFHRGRPLVLMAPDGTRHSASQHPSNFNWHVADGYELITISKPFEGEWQMEAETEAGSRVTIVSNLSLDAESLPTYLFPDEPPLLRATLSERGAPLARPDLLKLVTVSGRIRRRDDGERWQVELEPAGEATYEARLPMLTEPGAYEVGIVADGKTFQRRWQQLVTSREHFQLQSTTTDESPARHHLRIERLNPAVDLERSELSVVHEGSAVEPLRTEAGWELMVPIAAARRVYEIEVAMHLQDGHKAKWRAGEVVLEGEQVTRAAPEPIATAASIDTTPTMSAKEAPDLAPEQVAPSTAATPDWRRWAIYGGIALGNLLLLGLAVFAVRRILGSGKSPVLEESPEATDSEPTAAATRPAAAPAPAIPLDDLALDVIDLD